MFWFFIMPWIIGFILLTGGPIFASMVLSFTKYDVLTAPNFIGFDNYVHLFNDRLFYKSLSTTLYYTVLAVPFVNILALLLALLLNQKVRGIGVFRVIFYAPSVVSGVAICFLWAWLLNSDFGIVNYVLSLVHIKGPAWFSSSSTVIPSLVLTTLTGIGGTMVIYLASMQSLSAEIFEAAAIDGANPFRRFFAITIPLLSPVILFNGIMTMIAAIQIFVPSFVITKGGPDWGSYFYVYYLFDNAFSQFRMGYASAQAWILFVITFAMTLLALKVSKRYVHY
ncbi:ABC transporter permease [Gordoniibacillus kamchatkensis]|uniref:ABC transporter permease n=2 Tax=Gordoniibacillus kamchatkensis TaxID=1590651 RepID=A0ABR5ANF3_9BACL|nr:ABC transporter permease [Paenibacillus sp. VKM B-2647]